ncbi:MAG: hypothetical protein LBK57_00185 [Clostridiales Family XIII bacterium]|jgi:hypothetical protein|nr:hypothetical protein [Clostridiales Family XIII bacterium]
MKRKTPDIQKTSRTLTIISITERIGVISGGIALIALGYSQWGIACIALSVITLAAIAVKTKYPNREKLLSNAKSIGGILLFTLGGAALIRSGQIAGGIACVAVCSVKTIEDAFIMPWVEKKYLGV